MFCHEMKRNHNQAPKTGCGQQTTGKYVIMTPDSVPKKQAAAENRAAKSETICLAVDPGICGFPCLVKARKLDARKVALQIAESDCGQIQRLSERLTEMSLHDLFLPATRNPVYVEAAASSCHPSCPIPAAVLKAAEVAMDMALPKDVYIRFEPCEKDKSNGS
jgi:hypothetical protein